MLCFATVFFALALPAKGVCQMLQIRDTDGDILEFIEYDDARGSKPLFILDGLRLGEAVLK